VFGYAPPAYSPDGSLLLTVAQGVPPSALQVRDAHTLRVLRTLPLDAGWLHANPGPITPLGISADRRHAFFTYEQGTASGAPGPAFLDVWNLETGRRTTVRLGSPGLRTAAFVDNERIVTVTSGAVETWDPTRLRLLSTTRLRAPIGGQFAAIAPDGRTVAGFAGGSGGGAPGLIFVDAKTGHSVPAQGGPGPGASFHFVRFSPDDHTVATTLTDGRVVLWDARTGQPTATLVGHGGDSTGADFARDGRTLYSSSLDGAVIEWALDGTRRFGRPFTGPTQPYSLPNVPQTPPLAVSPDGTLLAMRVGEDRVGLYALPTTKRGAILPAGHGVVTARAWSPNGVLAAATTRGGVRMWRGKQPAGEISGLGPVQAMTFSPNGELLAADLKQLVAQHAPGNGPRATVRLPTAATALAVAPSGRRAAVGLGDVGVAIVDLGALHIIRMLHPIGTNTSVAFTSDGSLLTGSFQGLVQRWRLNGDEIGRPIRAASGPVAAITVAPGGATFATSSLTEGVVRLWRTATLEQFGAQLPGPPYVLTNVTFTPDGSGLVVLYHTGQGMLWPMTDAAWRRHACSVAGRNMSRLEWAQFVGSRAYARTC
jgi:WD40 repeat protein